MSTASLIIRTTLPILVATLAACGGIEEDTTLRPVGPTGLGEPGEPGAPGGAGGRVTVRYGALQQASPAELLDALDVVGGGGGAPGAHGEPDPAGAAPARPGADGRDGSPSLWQDPGLALDLSGVEPDDALLVSAGDIYLKTKLLQGPLRVRRVVVAPGVSLQLSGGWVIEADEVLVSPGASIVVSDRGEKTKDVLGSAVGHHGGDLVLRARKLELYGDIIASGEAGATGEAGGDGGQVLVEAETLLLGDGAGIHAAGGAGGAGADGQACSVE